MTDFSGVATTIWNPKLVKMFIAKAVNSLSALSKASSSTTGAYIGTPWSFPPS